ncbi:5578_t:CDS:2 [Funneliformis caledonium]|uniref:5578_t:CDS:1 n=1 Tax=Funneliformis caledonium TaxID=1117310 RepID=A0A9N8Z351_9GLOM|nr:5578_t:CDS:2 [Funneliformis caledonium]
MTINKIRIYLDYNEDEELLFRENLNKFLAKVPLGSNINIGAHELIWMENYESDLIIFISLFSLTNVKEVF